MDDFTDRPTISLYDEDFYAWTQAQAALLREGRFDEADVANILEEIETLGRTEVAELRARLKVLAHHLLKEIYQPEKASRSWATTIVVHRLELERQLKENPSLKPERLAMFAEAYADARKLATVETGIRIETVPNDPPFTFEQAMDESFWPGRSIEDRD